MLEVTLLNPFYKDNTITALVDALSNKISDYKYIPENLQLLSNYVTGQKNVLSGCMYSTALRDKYNLHITQAREDFYTKIQHDVYAKTPQEWAQEAIEIRSHCKEGMFYDNLLVGQIGIWLRNGGNHGGTTLEKLVAKGKTIEEIINSAFRTDGKDLGLYGNDSDDFLPEGYFDNAWHLDVMPSIEIAA